MCRSLLILFVSEGLLFIQLRMQVVNRRCFCLHPVNRLGFSFPPRADLLVFVTRLASIIRIGRYCNNILGIMVSVRVSVNYFKRHSFSALDLLLSITNLRVGLLLVLPTTSRQKSARTGTSRAHISAPSCSTIIFTNS